MKGKKENFIVVYYLSCSRSRHQINLHNKYTQNLIDYYKLSNIAERAIININARFKRFLRKYMH